MLLSNWMNPFRMNLLASTWRRPARRKRRLYGAPPIGPSEELQSRLMLTSPGFTVSGGPLTVDEWGMMQSIDVVLDAAPLTNVVFDVSTDNSLESTLDYISLTFTPLDWDMMQTVEVTGKDDTVIDGDIAHQVTVSVSLASDAAFIALAPQMVAVTTLDDETASFTVSEGPLVVDETGTTAQFTVVLDGPPVSNVVLNVTSDDSTESAPSSTSLTFTPTNWNTSQTVTLTGQDDSLWDGDVEHLVTVSVDAAGSHDAFDAAADQTIDVTTEDDEVAEISLNGKNGDIVGTPVIPAGLAYVISGGDTDNLFGTTGLVVFEITLTTHLLEDQPSTEGNGTLYNAVVPTQREYDLELTLSNGPFIVGTRTVTVRILPVVGLTGDTHVVEGTDELTITFVRKDVDLTTSFDASFQYA